MEPLYPPDRREVRCLRRSHLTGVRDRQGPMFPHHG